MSDPIEPIRHKMTEAMPDRAQDGTDPDQERPDQEPGAPKPSEMKVHNADVQPGVKEHMVDIGRGEQTKGRGGQ